MGDEAQRELGTHPEGSRDDERTVSIDVETATETVTRQEDVDRIRREAGVEDGEVPPRGEPSGEDSEVGQLKPRGGEDDPA